MAVPPPAARPRAPPRAKATEPEPALPPAARVPLGKGLEWAEKHRPQHLAEIIGNPKALVAMKDWAESWKAGVPDKAALVLEGPPGVGKTTAAHALARDMGWDLIELNASDARSAPIIERIAGTGAVSTTFSADGAFRKASEGGRTLVLLDEADNLYERGGAAATSGGDDMSDRGGKRAIIETIRKTRQPIILIVNDAYALYKGTGGPLRSLALSIRFAHPQSRSVAKRLGEIAKLESIDADAEALLKIAEGAGGDLRAAMNDFQAAAQGRTAITAADVKGLGARDAHRSIFDAMPDIFKSMDIARAREAGRDVEENPESLILWIDENLPLEYREPADLVRGYEALSRADVFLGRVRRRQYYGFWSYASDLMTAGVTVAKKAPYKGWTRWQFPGWLRLMSSSKARRGLRDGLARKIGAHTHTGMREARSEGLAPMARLFTADEELAVAAGADMELTPDELAFLLDEKPAAARIIQLSGLIAAELERRPRASTAMWADDDAPEGAADDEEDAVAAEDEAEQEENDDDDEAPKKAAKTTATKKGKPTATPAPDEENAEEETKKPAPSRGQKGLFEY